MEKAALLPWHWDNTCSCVAIKEDKVRWSRLCTQIHLTFVFVILLQGVLCFILQLKEIPQNKIAFWDAFLYGVNLVNLIPTHLLLRAITNQSRSLCFYTNAVILGCKQNKFKNKWKKCDKPIQLLCLIEAYAILPSVVIYPFIIVFGLHGYSPCKPSLAGYFLLFECSSKSNYKLTLPLICLEYFLKIVVFSVNYLALAISTLCCGFTIAVIEILFVLNFSTFLREFEENLKQERLRRTFKEETHLKYRNIQILTIMFNEFTQFIVTPTVLVGGIVVVSMSTVGVVSVPWNSMHMPWCVILCILLINGIFALVIVFGNMAQIYAKSKRLIESSKTRTRVVFFTGKTYHKIDAKWRGRFYMSCSPIKFKFGRLNFIDRLTPLNCIIFANRMSVQLLLLVKRTMLNN